MRAQRSNPVSKSHVVPLDRFVAALVAMTARRCGLSISAGRNDPFSPRAGRRWPEGPDEGLRRPLQKSPRSPSPRPSPRKRGEGGAAGLRRIGFALLVAMLAAGPVATARAETPLAGAPSTEAVAGFAIRWYTEMMAGRTDRSLYAPGFAPQVTDEAVARMSHDLNEYGAAPLRAEIVQIKKEADQTFTTIKFVFPRGDASSLLFGFDAAGRITGVAVRSMAGD